MMAPGSSVGRAHPRRMNSPHARARRAGGRTGGTNPRHHDGSGCGGDTAHSPSRTRLHAFVGDSIGAIGGAIVLLLVGLGILAVNLARSRPPMSAGQHGRPCAGPYHAGREVNA